MSFFSSLGSYVVARLGEASTYAGAAAVVNAAIQHQGSPAIVQASLGFLAILLPASITGPLKTVFGSSPPAK